MPAFPLTDSPAQISQSITQDALLQNTGESVIYLSNESAVSPASYGLRLTPRGTVTWPANRELWATVAAGESGTLSVLYNAAGAAVSEVTADIPGVVNVATTQPVLIQGGGEVLGDGSQTVAPGMFVVDVPAPASGLKYPSLRFQLRNITATTVLSNYATYAVYSNNGSVAYGSLVCPDTSAPELFAIGQPGDHTFTIPFDGDYPVSIVFQVHGAIPLNLNWVVWGSSAAVTEPTSDWTNHFVNGQSRVAIPLVTTGATRTLLLPACYETKWISAYAGVSANMGNTSMSAAGQNGTYVGILDQPHISRSWLATDASGNLTDRSAMEFPLPPLGRVTVFTVATQGSNAGTVYFSFYR